MKKIEIFKAGSWTSAEGQTIRFTERDLQRTAAAYDPAKFDAPLVLGHPKTDDPAYGWVKRLSYAAGKLFAEIDDLEPAFSDAVSKKRYKKISASFYAPAHPGNPVPGTYYLRHVGFLGAAAPAVKGLKPVSFADAASLTFDFAEENGNSEEAKAAGILGKIKELIAEKFGDDDAEKAVPAEDLAALEEKPAAAEETSEKTDDPTKKDEDEDKEKEKQESAFAEREAALAKREKELKHAENEQFLDTLISAGRLMPGMKNKVLNFMDALANGDALSFSEKADTFREILTSLPKVVEFSEKSKPETLSAQTASFSAPEGYLVNADRLELHQKITQYCETHQGVSYAEAAKIIGG